MRHTISMTFVRNCVIGATTMIVASIVGVCVCSTFCCGSLYGFSGVATIFLGQGRESWLLCFVCFPVVL